MCESVSGNKTSNTVKPVIGQYHKFMPLPVMAHNAHWIDAGPIAIAIEARVLGKEGKVLQRGASLHVFKADRSEEYLRFDWFDHTSHYHYILNELQHNILWAYDIDINGPMEDWIIGVLRHNLPAALRRANAAPVAARVEEEGIRPSAIDEAARELKAAFARTYPGADMIEEGQAWYARWKQLHPQFNTVDDDH